MHHRLQQALIFIVMIAWGISPALAYDNNVFPEFQIAKEDRRFSWISIHPDNARWLITECTDRIEPPTDKCYLFIYNIKTKEYRRLDLPAEYSYLQGEFSPSGRQIAAVRVPVPRNESYEEMEKSAMNADLLLMRTDGDQVRKAGIPKGILGALAWSPDETKVAYWSAAMIRPKGSKSFRADFDLHEYDLQTEVNRLFSGEFHFFLVGRLQYRNADQIVANASGPLRAKKSTFAEEKKFKFSRVYCFEREVTHLQDPCYSLVPHAAHPALDTKGNLYLQGQDEQHGLSLYKLSADREMQHWTIPRIENIGITFQSVSPSGDHLGFIYSVGGFSRRGYQSSLGYFDFSTERWIPLSLPKPESAAISSHTQ